MNLIKVLVRAVPCGVLMSGALFAAPLDNWHWRNPLANGNPTHSLYGVTFTNGRFVAVGEVGTVSISTDTTNWMEFSTAITNRLRSVTCSNGLFVAVGDAGGVEASSDGTNWVAGVSGTSASLKSVAYGDGLFVAVGTGGTIITSTDGTNWTSQFVFTSGDFTSVAYGSAGFLAANLDGYVYVSADGVSEWIGQPLGPGTGGWGSSYQLHDVITFAQGHYIVASRYKYISGVQYTYPCIFSSSDGYTWTSNIFSALLGSTTFYYRFLLEGDGWVMASDGHFSTNGGVTWINATVSGGSYSYITAATCGDGTAVGVAYDQIDASSDGLTWTDQLRVGPIGNFSSVAQGNGAHVVAGGSTMTRSTDGLVYTSVAGTPALTSVILTANGFIGVGSGGKIYQSDDGFTWNQRTSGTANTLSGVVAGGGVTVTVGNGGTILVSSDSTNWAGATSGTAQNLYDVAFAVGQFVVVGHLGTVLTSPDGSNWAAQDSGQLTNLLSVTYGPAGFLAAGPGGVVLTSLDATNWTAQSTGTNAAFRSASSGNGYYLVTGDNAVALTSLDGVAWMARDLGCTGGQNILGSTFIDGRFVAVGSSGTILESDPIVSPYEIQIQPSGDWLKLLAPAGGNFRLQTCTNLEAPVWQDVDSFSNVDTVTFWTNSQPMVNQLFYRMIRP